ncbi:MAG: hypothetical protein QOK48_586 [Blastocatellia bacterium]|jgi:hypothetical protein|nr:hypothetical protein [Blastocatellia bacterium]
MTRFDFAYNHALELPPLFNQIAEATPQLLNGFFPRRPG